MIARLVEFIREKVNSGRFKRFAELCARVECENGGRCMAGVCVCPEICPESNGEPVCGSDAKTYQSECELQKAACGRDPKLPALHVIFYGDCGERFAVAALSKLKNSLLRKLLSIKLVRRSKIRTMCRREGKKGSRKNNLPFVETMDNARQSRSRARRFAISIGQKDIEGSIETGISNARSIAL